MIKKSEISSFVIALCPRRSLLDLRDHHNHCREEPEGFHDADNDERIASDRMDEKTDETTEIPKGQTFEKRIFRVSIDSQGVSVYRY